MTSLQAAMASFGWLLTGFVASLVGAGPGLGVLTALGLAGVAVLVFAWMLGRLAGIPGIEPPPGRRPQRDRAVFVRFRDPDTAGRPRPRAPSGSLALA